MAAEPSALPSSRAQRCAATPASATSENRAPVQNVVAGSALVHSPPAMKLAAAGALSLQRATQDGMRVRDRQRLSRQGGGIRSLAPRGMTNTTGRSVRGCRATARR